MFWLSLLFLLIAFLYASVGFGGGSTYTAILSLTDVPFNTIPMISLACNLAVVSGSLIRFSQAGQLPWKTAFPYLLLSVPVAWWMGTLPLEKGIFLLILGLALLLSAVAMLWPTPSESEPQHPRLATRFALGGAFGGLAGLVGIGGGIFLAPSLHVLRADTPKHIAATASLFIAANSVAGLLGHYSKLGTFEPVIDHFGLLVAVVIGGQLGNWITLNILPAKWLKVATAIMVVYVGGRLLLLSSESL